MADLRKGSYRCTKKRGRQCTSEVMDASKNEIITKAKELKVSVSKANFKK